MKIFVFTDSESDKPALERNLIEEGFFFFNNRHKYGDPGNQEKLSSEIIKHTYEELRQADLIIIDLFNGAEENRYRFYIGHRIRLDGELRTKPIIFLGNFEILDLMESSPDLPLILITKGQRYFMDNSWMLELKHHYQRIQEEASLFSDPKTFHDSILKKIRIPEADRQGRHSIANQWGARQLASSAGLEISEMEFSDRIYFQYLVAAVPENKLDKNKQNKEENSEKKSEEKEFSLVRPEKVLLIDDNHNLGWKLVLNKLFNNGPDDKKEYIDAFPDFSSVDKSLIRSHKYDFVLLDFYFGEGDLKGKGLDILTEIKEINPVLPVIMFTASNKAWNMNELYEAGADGYYIKEHPDTAADANFAKNNFENFILTINQSVLKSKLLSPYWQALEEIRKNFAQNKGPIIEVKKGNQESVFRPRIVERIEMSIGLLKKAFHQSRFDKKFFHYSDYELAFLTLWSTLNEIQETIFEKVKSDLRVIPTGVGSFIPLKNQDGSIFYYESGWRLIGQKGDYYFRYKNPKLSIDYNGGFRKDLDGKFTVDREMECFLKFENNKEPYYSTTRSKDGKLEKAYTFQPDQRLSFQIAFFLLESNYLKGQISIKPYLIKLKNINEIRNGLYLTHNPRDFFPVHTIAKDRKPDSYWEKQINSLFSIIYLICTAKEWNPSN